MIGITVSDRLNRSGNIQFTEYENIVAKQPKYFDQQEQDQDDIKLKILQKILSLNFSQFQFLKLLIDPRMTKKMMQKYYKTGSDGVQYKIKKFNKKYPEFASLTKIK